tara:strand:- start:3247 stop:4146 length:900 start_codon:yes stop_codon:yes gene_type:complete
MGLYNGDLNNYYANPPTGNEVLGSYQFISIEDIINNFRVAYVGEDKIISKISRADIRFHAMRGLQELTYDTFKSCKTLELEIPPSLILPLPHDYVNYVKITWLDDNGHCRTMRECKTCPKDPLSYKQDKNGDIVVGSGDADIPSTPITEEDSTTWEVLQNQSTTKTDGTEDTSYEKLIGARYGLDPQHANINGCFWINCRTGQIYFDSNLVGKTMTIQYISDSAATDGEMLVHKFAEEAMYRHIAWSILNTRSNVDGNIVARYKKERFAAVRNAKLRLSNIKLEEITQILRGKSKWIKH